MTKFSVHKGLFHPHVVKISTVCVTFHYILLQMYISTKVQRRASFGSSGVINIFMAHF